MIPTSLPAILLFLLIVIATFASLAATRTGGRQRRAFLAAVVLVVLGVVCSLAAGYVSRSPLRPNEPLHSLIRFDADFIVQISDPEAAWREMQDTPRMREVLATGQGRAFVASTTLGRSVERIDGRGRMLGRSVFDSWDLVRRGTVVAGVRAPDGRHSLLFLGRVEPATNLALGAYAALAESQPLATPAGDWWMISDTGAPVFWTKLGDVVAASDDADTLGRFVASARSVRARPTPLAGRLFAGDAPQAVVDVQSFLNPGEPGAWSGALVLSLRLGGQERAVEPEAAAFRTIACGCMPADTCTGAVWRLDPADAWRLALDMLSQADSDEVVRYAEDRLCAVLDADDFERDVLGRFTGDFALAVSNLPDRWLTLASGQAVPTVSMVARIRTDPHFERRLKYVLAEVAGVIGRRGKGFVVSVGEQKHEGRVIKVIHVQRAGSGNGASAGFFVEPDKSSPGHSLVVVSTSVEWLKRSVDARTGTVPALDRQDWFRGVERGASADAAVFGFASGDLLAGVIGGMRGPKAGASGLEQLLRLFGSIGLEGELDENGSLLRGDIWITGEGRPQEK